MATLTLTFTVSNPPPAYGYTVKYREIGSSQWFYSSGHYTSPAQIPGLSGTAYEGTIYAVCAIKCKDCRTYQFMPFGPDDSMYRITAVLCDGTAYDSGELYVAGGGIASICALKDSVNIYNYGTGGVVAVSDTEVCGGGFKGSCGPEDVTSNEVPWSVTRSNEVSGTNYLLVQPTEANSTSTRLRAKISFQPFAGAASYQLEYSLDPSTTSGQPPAGGWLTYSSQPITPQATYFNAAADLLGPNSAGLMQLVNNNFEEPWIRIKARESSGTVIGTTSFPLYSGASQIPQLSHIAYITVGGSGECNNLLVTGGPGGSSIEWFDCDGNFQGVTLAENNTMTVCTTGGLVTSDGATVTTIGSCSGSDTVVYSYPGTGIAAGYTYYSVVEGAYQSLFTVTAADTPTTILQKLADALQPGVHTVTGNSFTIDSSYSVGNIYAHAT